MPQAGEIRQELGRIVGSAGFRGSLHLKRFISFVVETTLAGKGDRIKAYTIAVEALGRSADFDPQQDPIVRVEARRLRQALARYYAEAGRVDPLIIELPRGTYVPTFGRRTLPAVPQRDHPVRAHANGSVTPADRADDVDRAQQFTRNVSSFLELAVAHHEKAASMTDAGRSIRRTLNRSSDLLLASARFDPAPRLAPAAAALGSGIRTADADAKPGDAPGLASPPQPQPPRQTSAVPAKGTIHGPLNFVATQLRAHAQIIGLACFVIATLTVLAAAFAFERSLTGNGNTGLFFGMGTPAQPTVAQFPSDADSPILYVEPVSAFGEPKPDMPSPSMIRGRLIDTLARFDDVTVVADPPRMAPPASASAPAGMPSYYRIAASVQYLSDGPVTLIAQAFDATDGTVAWSQTFTRGGPAGADIDGIAVKIAQTLLDQFGVIQAREAVKRATSSNLHDTYRCILDANAYLRGYNPSFYEPVRDCLVHATTEHPPSVSVFVKLSRLYMHDYQFGGVDGPPGDRAALDQAYRMAARAIEVKPGSAPAHFAMEQVSLAQGDLARAKIADEVALGLNPDDSAIIFGHASLLILTGQLADGIAALKANAAKPPLNWTGYHFLMALACYLKGDLATAAVETDPIANKNFPPGLMLQAIVAEKSGDSARARKAVALLDAEHPSWRENSRANIALLLPDRPMAERIADDFAAAAAGLTQ